jgi:peptide/nickel transport system ATP-binding protein
MIKAPAELLLRVKNLELHYKTQNGIVRAVDGVSFDLNRGEALVILGESGCGKSSLSKAILRVLPRNISKYSGQVFLEDQDIMKLSDEHFRRKVQWRRIAFVMQAAMNALNPVIKVGEQVAEPLMVHFGLPKKRALEKAAETFKTVGIAPDFLARYPFELSGGMRQRAVLAMALITEPDIILMDEPTSALDVLTQASIMNVLKKIKQEKGISFILITHDVATSSEIADRVALMYAGQLVEVNSSETFFHDPMHPYSKLLMASVPRLRQTQAPDYIPGQPPNLLNVPTGCRFKDRCPKAFDKCAEPPVVVKLNKRDTVRCWLHEELKGNL